MAQYEYKVVPAPVKSERFTGKAKTDDAYALTVAKLMNDHGRDGWQYVRTDRLTQRGLSWLFGGVRRHRELLVFSRATVPLVTRPAPVDAEASKIRSRRVRQKDLVDFVRSGGRKVEAESAALSTAAE